MSGLDFLKTYWLQFNISPVSSKILQTEIDWINALGSNGRRIYKIINAFSLAIIVFFYEIVPNIFDGK